MASKIKYSYGVDRYNNTCSAFVILTDSYQLRICSSGPADTDCTLAVYIQVYEEKHTIQNEQDIKCILLPVMTESLTYLLNDCDAFININDIRKKKIITTYNKQTGVHCNTTVVIPIRSPAILERLNTANDMFDIIIKRDYICTNELIMNETIIIPIISDWDTLLTDIIPPGIIPGTTTTTVRQFYDAISNNGFFQLTIKANESSLLTHYSFRLIDEINNSLTIQVMSRYVDSDLISITRESQ
jgi:hypothetical protein